MTDQYEVQIIAFEGDEILKRMGPMPKRRAEKVDDGVNINLNHMAYYTMIRPVSDESEGA